MSARFRLTKSAANDLLQIADYISDEDPTAAERVVDDIVSAIEKLIKFPEMGRSREDLAFLLRSCDAAASRNACNLSGVWPRLHPSRRRLKRRRLLRMSGKSRSHHKIPLSLRRPHFLSGRLEGCLPPRTDLKLPSL